MGVYFTRASKVTASIRVNELFFGYRICTNPCHIVDLHFDRKFAGDILGKSLVTLSLITNPYLSCLMSSKSRCVKSVKTHTWQTRYLLRYALTELKKSLKSCRSKALLLQAN